MPIYVLKRTTIFRMQANPTSIFSTPTSVGSGTRWRRGPTSSRGPAVVNPGAGCGHTLIGRGWAGTGGAPTR
jgi:hypothetical protein